MRTTLSLEDDVAVLLERVQRTKKLKFKEAVNDALRSGLKQMLGPAETPKAFKSKAVDLGRCLIGDVDNVADALAYAEGENFR